MLARQQRADLLHGRRKSYHQVHRGWRCWLLQTQSGWRWGLGELCVAFAGNPKLILMPRWPLVRHKCQRRWWGGWGVCPGYSIPCSTLVVVHSCLLSFHYCYRCHCQFSYLFYSFILIFIYLLRVIEALLGQHIPPRPASVRWHEWYGAIQFAGVDTIMPWYEKRQLSQLSDGIIHDGIVVKPQETL